MAITLLNVSPAGNSVITPSTPVEFDVKTPVGSPFLRIIVTFHFPGLEFTEVAYAQNPADVSLGQTFEELYNGFASITPVVDGGFQHFKFHILRRPLWPDSPQLAVYAFNTAGQEL